MSNPTPTDPVTVSPAVTPPGFAIPARRDVTNNGQRICSQCGAFSVFGSAGCSDPVWCATSAEVAS